eukprot:2991209-Amphidinium_carterae.2
MKEVNNATTSVSHLTCASCVYVCQDCSKVGALSLSSWPQKMQGGLADVLHGVSMSLTLPSRHIPQ